MKQRNDSKVPRARKADLVVRQMPDEVLVYDLRKDEAHCLNRSTAFVWQQCNGRRTVGDVARALEAELKSPASQQMVWLALEQLRQFELLDGEVSRPAGLPRVSRRDLIRLGVAAVAVPSIISIVAPTAANAQTAIAPATCTARTQPDCGGTPCTGGGNRTCQPVGGTNCQCQ